ncbi:MAG TPA: PorV/PorQ family protein [Elusimicrobiales bacterium]|nr:PorV/PorQ family protein [Elusimicrobiales bacterium]
MKIIRNLALLTAASAAMQALYAWPAAAASSYAGTSGAQFLKLGAGSKAGAVAEAYTAAADDVYSGYYNPAGLTRMVSSEFAAQYVSYFQDMSYSFLAFAMPLDKRDGFSRHALGVSIYNLSASDLEARTEDTLLAAGLFDASESAYALSYAYRLNKGLGIGATMKYVRESIDTESAGAVAADAGVHYRPLADRPLDLGLTVRNMGSKLDFGDGSDPLPLGGVFGVSYSFLPGLRAECDLAQYRDTDMIVAGGAEYTHDLKYDMSGALRLGYTTHNKDVGGLKGIAAGAGLRYSRVYFDFAWVPFGDLGNTFRYTISARF